MSRIGQDGKKKRHYIITGAAGHLGSTIIRQLLGVRTADADAYEPFSSEAEEFEIRIFGFLLEGTKPVILDDKIDYFYGDISQLFTLKDLFERACAETDCEIYVIHTAAMISIEDRISEKLYEVNVNGTRNVLNMCRQYPVKRLVHVSSVHAITELPEGRVMSEPASFSPESVTGAYAKSKATAVNFVLEEIKQGLDAVIVFPSGIIGPYDGGSNHLIQMVRDFIEGRLKACVTGGYDFVDVRDVANGCISASTRGRCAQGYILSGSYLSVEALLNLAADCIGKKHVRVLPMALAKAGLPLIRFYSKVFRARPLYTKYSLYTLCANSLFDHGKAKKELGYRTRTPDRSMEDTVKWLISLKDKHSV